MFLISYIYHTVYVKAVYGLPHPRIYLKKKNLSPFILKKFYSCLLLNEIYQNLNRRSCMLTFMSSLSSGYLEIQYQFCSLVSFLTSVSLEQLFVYWCTPSQPFKLVFDPFLSSFVSSSWQCSSKLEKVASAVFIISFC